MVGISGPILVDRRAATLDLWPRFGAGTSANSANCTQEPDSRFLKSSCMLLGSTATTCNYQNHLLL